jgi:hypothetical protein
MLIQPHRKELVVVNGPSGKSLPHPPNLLPPVLNNQDASNVKKVSLKNCRKCGCIKIQEMEHKITGL